MMVHTAAKDEKYFRSKTDPIILIFFNLNSKVLYHLLANDGAHFFLPIFTAAKGEKYFSIILKMSFYDLKQKNWRFLDFNTCNLQTVNHQTFFFRLVNKNWDEKSKCLIAPKQSDLQILEKQDKSIFENWTIRFPTLVLRLLGNHSGEY